MPSLTDRIPLVGREQELAALLRSLDASQTGQGQLVLVAGEPGIGKTRLLDELAERAKLEGWQVLIGHAYESEGMPPYLPFSEALRDYVRPLPLEDLRAQIDEAGPDVALLAPDIRRRLADLQTNPPASPEEQRYRLFDSVCDFLLGIPGHADTRGLTLILDDLHWADPSSLLLFQHLARRLTRGRLLLVGAYRSEEVSRGHPLAAVLADLRRESIGERLALAPLPAAAIEELVRELAGVAPAPVVLQAIEHQTEGNPFFVGEVVRDLLANRRDLSAPATAAEASGVPEGVREVIERRLGRLSRRTISMLRTAAVLGDSFSLEELRAAGVAEAAGLLDVLDEATGAGVLRESGDGFQFGHALIRQTVHDGLGLARRQELNLRAAEALERMQPGNLGPYVAALARHYRLAGPAAGPEKAIEYSLGAGEAAEAAFGYEEATTQWDAALRLMEERGVHAERRISLLDRLGGLMRTIGFDRYPEAISYWQRALTLCEEMGDAERAAEQHCRLAIILASSDAATMDLPAALAHLRAARPVLEHGPDRDSQLQLYRAREFVFNYTGQAREGLEASERAMTLAERLGDKKGWVFDARQHGNDLIASGRLGEGLTLTEDAWEVANRLNQTLAGRQTALWRGTAAFRLGDPRDTVGWLEREASLLRQTQARGQRQVLLETLICMYAVCGELAEARRLQGEIGDRLSVHRHTVGGLWQAMVAYWTGDWNQAESLWTEAHDREQRGGNRLQQSFFACWLARVKQVRGDTAAAEALLQEGLAIAVDGPNVPIEVMARAALALLAAQTGRQQAAQPHLKRLRQVLMEGENWRGLAGRIALAEAAVAGTSGQPDEAAQHFECAISIFQRYGLPWDEAETLHWWGRSLLAAGHRRAAAAKLDATTEIYRDRGAGEAWVEYVLADRRDTEGRAGRKRRQVGPTELVGPDGLSAREVEVLRLIAAGKSNSAIAETLVISPNTVFRHVNHIFAKTGARNRTEAASYAHRRGLAE